MAADRRAPLTVAGLLVLAALAPVAGGVVPAADGTVPAGGGGASVVAGPPVPVADGGHATRTGAPVDCFPGDGHEFVIGTGGPRIHLTVHLSLFTNLGGPGTLGMEAVGTTGRHEVVRLRTGVLFAGVEDAATLLSNPFAPFAVVYQYRFRLPMFAGVADGDFAYEEEGSPVRGPVGEADCADDIGGA